MAYTVVPTKSTGDPAYTSSFLNTYIRDNFAAGVPDIFTTKGDIAAATAADTATRVAVGSNNTVFQIQSGQSAGVQFRAQPAADKITAKGDILVATAENVVTNVSASSYKYAQLMADSSASSGVSWRTNAAGKTSTGALVNSGNSLGSGILYPMICGTFGGETIDVARALFQNSGFFRAPRNGYYLFTVVGRFSSVSESDNDKYAYVITDDASGDTLTELANFHVMDTGTSNFSLFGSDILYLTASQGVYWKCYFVSSTSTTSHNNNADDGGLAVICIGGK